MQTLRIITDNESPTKSPNTDLVAHWETCGGKLFERGGYEDVIEKQDDGTTRRFVTWVVDTTEAACIQGESITFDEFRRRWESLDWCRAHPEHLISYLRAARDNARDRKQWAKARSTGVRVRNGNRSAVVYPDSPQWLKDEVAKTF